jgi:hypothetical protein
MKFTSSCEVSIGLEYIIVSLGSLDEVDIKSPSFKM